MTASSPQPPADVPAKDTTLLQLAARGQSFRNRQLPTLLVEGENGSPCVSIGSGSKSPASSVQLSRESKEPPKRNSEEGVNNNNSGLGDKGPTGSPSAAASRHLALRANRSFVGGPSPSSPKFQPMNRKSQHNTPTHAPSPVLSSTVKQQEDLSNPCNSRKEEEPKGCSSTLSRVRRGKLVATIVVGARNRPSRFQDAPLIQVPQGRKKLPNPSAFSGPAAFSSGYNEKKTAEIGCSSPTNRARVSASLGLNRRHETLAAGAGTTNSGSGSSNWERARMAIRRQNEARSSVQKVGSGFNFFQSSRLSSKSEESVVASSRENSKAKSISSPKLLPESSEENPKLLERSFGEDILHAAQRLKTCLEANTEKERTMGLGLIGGEDDDGGLGLTSRVSKKKTLANLEALEEEICGLEKLLKETRKWLIPVNNT